MLIYTLTPAMPFKPISCFFLSEIFILFLHFKQVYLEKNIPAFINQLKNSLLSCFQYSKKYTHTSTILTSTIIVIIYYLDENMWKNICMKVKDPKRNKINGRNLLKWLPSKLKVFHPLANWKLCLQLRKETSWGLWRAKY